jgi:hypothetical protein
MAEPGTRWRVDAQAGTCVLLVDSDGTLKAESEEGLTLEDLKSRYVLVTVPEKLMLEPDIIAFDRGGDTIWALDRGYGAILAVVAPGEEVIAGEGSAATVEQGV